MPSDIRLSEPQGCVNSLDEKNTSKIYYGLSLLSCTEQRLKKYLPFLSPFYNSARLRMMKPSKEVRKYYFISMTEFLILEKLASCIKYKQIVNTSDSGVFPGYVALGKKAGCCSKTAERKVKALVEKGLIVKLKPDRRKNSSNTYYFTIKIQHLATLTWKLERQEEIKEHLKALVEKKPALQKTASQLAGMKGAKLLVFKEMTKSLFSKLESGDITVEEYIFKQKEVFQQEDALRKEEIISFDLKAPDRDKKLDRNVPTMGTETPPHPDVVSPEILIPNSSEEILKEPNITTTNMRSARSLNKVKISSSFRNYLFSLGFRFTKQHLEKHLTEILGGLTEKDLKEHIESFKSELCKHWLWNLFVYTTFSIKRLFEDEAPIIHGLKGEFKELGSRIEAGELLGYKNFKKLFKNEEEALKSVFPHIFEGRQEAKKAVVMRIDEYSEKIRKEFISLSSFCEIKTPDKAKEEFLKYVQGKYPDIVKTLQEKKKEKEVQSLADRIARKVEGRYDKFPLDRDLTQLAAQEVISLNEQSDCIMEVYFRLFEERASDRFISWKNERKKIQFISLGVDHLGVLPREIRYSNWGVNSETGSDEERFYLIGKMWSECGFKDNEKVYTSDTAKNEKIYRWLNENCDGLYDRLCSQEEPTAVEEKKVGVAEEESHQDRISRLHKEIYQSDGKDLFKAILAFLLEFTPEMKEDIYPTIYSQEDLINLYTISKGGK